MKSVLIILLMVTGFGFAGCVYHPYHDHDDHRHGGDRDDRRREHDHRDHWDERRDDGHMLDHRGELGQF